MGAHPRWYRISKRTPPLPSATPPQLAGIDLEGLLKQAKGEGWDPSKPVLEFDSGSERTEIWLEFQ